MKQVTLIALYGSKPLILSHLISECQDKIKREFPNSFIPYQLSQIHATLFSLERMDGNTYFNHNYYELRSQKKRMNFSKLLDFIRNRIEFPIQFQIGGFENRKYSFNSRNQRPYKRSFSIQGDKAVIIGWPVKAKSFQTTVLEYPKSLDEIRKAVQEYSILHSYHRKIEDIDNDFYFRIGLFKNDSQINSSRREILENEIREYLSVISPLIIQVTISDIYIASFIDSRLPINSTEIWSVDNKKMTPKFIESLYE